MQPDARLTFRTAAPGSQGAATAKIRKMSGMTAICVGKS